MRYFLFLRSAEEVMFFYIHGSNNNILFYECTKGEEM